MSDSENKAPFVDPLLVEWVQRLFPNKVPNETDTERQIWQAVGAQKVIANMRATVARQERDALENMTVLN